MRLRHGLVALLMLSGSSALATVWSASPGFEGQPTATDPVSQGDDEIRLMRAETRFRAEVESHFGNTVDADDNGTHRLGSARCFVQATAPTALETADYNNAIGTSASGTATLSDNATNSAPAETVGLGRCWIDTDGPDNVVGTGDDNTLYLYTATGWLPQSYNTKAGLINVGTGNLAYNGDFETEAAASTSVPSGWTSTAAVTFAYVTTDVTEGVGHAFKTTANGGALKGATQTLSGLKKATTYRVVARVKPATVVGACELVTTGGSANVAAISTGTGAFETLEGTFTTDNTPTAVVLGIESVADTNVCTWDHVGVFEQSLAGIPQGGVVRVRATRAAGADTANCPTTYRTGTCDGATTGLTVPITVPGPGYMLVADGKVAVEMQTNSVVCAAQLYNGAKIDESIVSAGASAGALAGSGVLPVHATVLNPTPGTTYTFDVDVKSGSANDCQVSGSIISWVEVLLVPTR